MDNIKLEISSICPSTYSENSLLVLGKKEDEEPQFFNIDLQT